LLLYPILNLLVTFTSRKTTNAIRINVMTEPTKWPTRKWPISIASQATFGVANYTSGIIMSLTRALTSALRYTPKIKATAIPITLYFEMKSKNSAQKPRGEGAGLLQNLSYTP